jgi:uncharacterized membrane protein
MALLIVAALIWIGIHVGLAGTPLRGAIVARVGETAFRGLFSVLSIAAISFLVRCYRAAPTTTIWYAPDWLRWVLVAAMLPAFVLFVLSLSPRNPTLVGGEARIGEPPRGVQRVTRHPMLWSFALWAAVHVVGNGDTAALVFFGAFLITALVGMPSVDARLARRDPVAWGALAAATSIVPFGAIVAGRNRFVVGEIGWVGPLVGVVVWAAVLYSHQWLFGMAPVIL